MRLGREGRNDRMCLLSLLFLSSFQERVWFAGINISSDEPNEMNEKAILQLNTTNQCDPSLPFH